MHPKNAHQGFYNFKSLTKASPSLAAFIITNQEGLSSINFSNPKAIYALNKAILHDEYGIKEWNLPEGYLCPPIPGRADYIHHIADLVSENTPITGLDVGTGANAIYPLLANAIHNWTMVGCDSNEESVVYAKQNTKPYKDITIRLQDTNSYLLKGIIQVGEYYDFTMCNPPFYTSAEAALKANSLKQKNLNLNSKERNFSGQANELFCNGGEALFIKRLIKESVHFKNQVGWFTCLLSRKQNLPNAIKQIEKLKATYRVIPMGQGNKQSRFIAWCFNNNKEG